MEIKNIVCGIHSEIVLPNDPSNLHGVIAVGGYGLIRVSWETPTLNPYAVAYYIIQRSTTPQLSTADIIGKTSSDFYVDTEMETEVLQYYWVTAISINGTRSPAEGPASALAEPSIKKVMEELTEQIDEGLLSQSLREEIARIGNIGSILNELSIDIDGEMDALGLIVQAAQSTIADAISAVESETAERRAEIDNLSISLNNSFSSISTVMDEQDALINALQAELSDLVGSPDWDANDSYLDGQVVKNDGGLYRALQNVPAGTPVSDTTYWEKVGNYESIGEAVASLLARMSTTDTRIDDITGQIDAHSQEFLAMQSNITDLDNEISGQASAINNLETNITEFDGKITAQAQEASSIKAQLREDDGTGDLVDALNSWDNRAQINETRQVIVEDKKAQAIINEQMTAQLGSNEASINDLSIIVATESEATSERFSEMTARVQGAESSITETQGVVSNNHLAATQAIDTHISEFNSNKSEVSEKLITLANEDVAFTQRLDSHVSEYESNKSTVESELITLSDADSALASQISTLETTVNEDITAAISAESTARADADSAISTTLSTHISEYDSNKASVNSQITTLSDEQSAHAQSINGLSVRVDGIDDDIDSISAEIVATNTVVANNKEAATQALESHVSVFNDNKASVDNKLETLSNEQSSQAQETSVIRAQFRDDDGTGDLVDALNAYDNRAQIIESRRVISNNHLSLTESLETHVSEFNDNKAAVQNQIVTLTTDQLSLATQIDTVEASLGDEIAAVQTTAKAWVDDLEDKTDAIGALYTVNVDVNGLVGGFGIYNSGESVEAGFEVDKFWLGSTKENKVKPFILSDGIVYIDTARIRDLGADNIKANAIQTIHMQANSIHGDRITAGTLHADKIQANTITADKIAGNAIEAQHIKAGEITTSKMRVADFTNLVFNGQFLESAEGWSNVIRTASSQIPTGFEGRFQRRDAYYGDHFPVVSGEVYRVSADIWRFNTPIASCSVGLHVILSDGTSTWIGGFTVAAPGSWNPTAYSGFVTIPTNAVTARFWVQYAISGSDHQTSNFWRGANFQLNRATTGQLLVDGAISTRHMTANSITAASGIIANAAITTAKIGDLAVNTLKISGNAVTTHAAWTGSSSDASVYINAPVGGTLTAFAVYSGGVSGRSTGRSAASTSSVTLSIPGKSSSSSVTTFRVPSGSAGGDNDASMFQSVTPSVTVATSNYVSGNSIRVRATSNGGLGRIVAIIAFLTAR